MYNTFSYNVLLNKCSGSCNTFDNPIAKLCAPNVIKRVNMQVYNFLMRLNETRNVLWHESCKCICKLNSSICNNKQIWNSDTCRCDCNEDFAGIINCTKGYTWNLSTCECQCDTWCKPGQYLDHKNCICKNKLVGRLTEECTSVINETMMNNNNYDNDNDYDYNINLSEYISMVVLDDNEKLLINEVLKVLIGVGTFTSISSFDTQSLQFVTMNKLKKSMSGGL